jgi:ABC-type glycerol-3-phosphate transport system permease component
MSQEISNQLSRRGRFPIFIGLVLLAASILLPLFFVVITSLRTNVEYSRNPFGLPSQVSLDNYVTLLNQYGVGQAFLNSLFVSSSSVVLILIIASVAGYALAKLPVPGSKVITGTFLGIMLFPGPVLIIPIYVMLARLGLIGDFEGLILVYVAGGLPFATFFFSLVFRAIPQEVIEAAQLDGAGYIRTLVSVIAPMSISGVITLAILQFLGTWNELIYALMILPDETSRLLTPALAMIGTRYVTEQPMVAAGLFVTASIPILLLLLASRYIIEGLQVSLRK